MPALTSPYDIVKLVNWATSKLQRHSSEIFANRQPKYYGVANSVVSGGRKQLQNRHSKFNASCHIY